MKKISFVLLIITMLCSCQETEFTSENQLLGEWKLTRLEICDKSTGEVLYTMETRADFVMTHLNVSSSAFVVTEYDEYEKDVTAFLYVVKDDKISLYEGWNFFVELIIEKITNNDLILSYEDEYLDDNDERKVILMRHYFVRQ